MESAEPADGRPGDGDRAAGATDAAVEIRLRSLTKRFGDVTAVDGISLDIRSGEFFSLLGPSGCGKTTTLRMIGGFELPTSGSIELQGRDITMDPPERRPVNMVFQSYALFPHLCVFDNVAFGLRRRKAPDAEVRRRVGATLELVHLTGFDKRRPDQLSGGQQQRVALARALVNEPTALLLDEPLGALDLKLRRQLQVELKRVQLEVGITFIYVTHDQEEALALSDRIAVMDRGHVEQLGTPEELYDTPQTRFVAGFIGTTNMVAGTIESKDGAVVVVRLESGERCLGPVGDLAVGSAVELAVRPEAVALAPDERGDVAASAPELRGVIQQTAYLGTSISHHVLTDGGLTIAAIVPRSHARRAPGDRVRISWQASDALILERPPEEEGQGQ